MHKHLTFRQKKSLIFLMLALFVLFGFLMRPFFKPIILASIIVILFYPVYSWLEKKLTPLLSRASGKHWLSPQYVSSFLSTLVVLVVLVFPSAWIITETVRQISDIINALNVQENVSQLLTAENYNLYVQPYLQRIESDYGIVVNLPKYATAMASWLTEVVSHAFPQIFIGTAGVVFNFFIMVVGVYFLFIEGPRLVRLAFDLSPLSVAHEKRLGRQFKNVIDATVLGYLVTSFVQGVLAAVMFKFTGLSSWVVLGAMTFFMSMVPIVGAAGVWIPVSLWFFLTGNYTGGIINVVWGAAVISGIDNFLKPIIIQGKTKIHPLLVFFSLFGGITFFGPIGIIFGPVVTSLLIASIRIYREEYL